jgi:hypothetical protein
LLLWNIIRVASPKAFDFLLDNFGDLTSKETSGRIDAECLKAVTDVSTADRDGLARVLAFLFGRDGMRGSVSRSAPPQSLRSDPVYKARMEMESIEEGIRDQRILRDVADWKKGESSGLETSIEENNEYIGVLERVNEAKVVEGGSLDQKDICQIASRVFANAIARGGADTDEESVPAFIPLWRLAMRPPRSAEYARWLSREVELALPVSLKFANNLEYYWGSIKFGLLGVEESAELRNQMIAWARKNLAPATLARILGRRYPWALHHLVVHATREPPAETANEDWRWIGSRLVAAIKLDQTVALHVCYLLSRSDRRVEAHPTGPAVSMPVMSLNEETLAKIVDSDTVQAELLTQLRDAHVTISELDDEEKATMAAIRREAARLLGTQN